MEDAKNQPPPKKLCGSLIYENEQTVLFAKQGLGKSILATQIAFAVSNGESLDLGNGLILENEVGIVDTIYFDFELSDTQNAKRIANAALPDNLHYIKVKRGYILESEPKKIFEQLKTAIKITGAKLVIIDNVSKISADLEKAENAKIFLDELWRLCRDHYYTVILISHTPKINA